MTGLRHGEVHNYFCIHNFVTPTTRKSYHAEMHKSEFNDFFVTPFHLRRHFWGYHNGVYEQ